VTAARAVVVALGALAVGCSAQRQLHPLRVAATESGGDFEFGLGEPVQAVTCVLRDHRRAPSDPASVRIIWAAKCTEGRDCPRSVRYGDRALATSTPAAPLAPSEEGFCYVCVLVAEDGRGQVSFRVSPQGAFEQCQPRVGDL
jgi:hypothetical protein